MELHFDFAEDEYRRRAAMLEAVDDEWSPIEAFEDEAEAYRILYGNLDAAQQRIYAELVEAGVLP